MSANANKSFGRWCRMKLETLFISLLPGISSLLLLTNETHKKDNEISFQYKCYGSVSPYNVLWTTGQHYGSVSPYNVLWTTGQHYGSVSSYNVLYNVKRLWNHSIMTDEQGWTDVATLFKCYFLVHGKKTAPAQIFFPYTVGSII